MVADVLDSMGVEPTVLAPTIRPVTSETRFVGPAYTIVGESHQSTATGDRPKLAAIDAMPPGVVPVWSGGDITGVCCFGDLLAEAMKQRGCVGVVVDGGVRDVSYLEQLGMPVRARYRSPAQAIGRWRVTATEETVRVRGALSEWVTIDPGDLIVSDEDGVIALKSSHVPRVCEEVRAWSGTETQSREAIRNGASLLSALDQFGHL
ncbi:RraA family protein [Mycolicibacterium agri]|uniref:RraA family protein n=1 Tax=Mycolicibacterium agri TaxID=36811 RepID=UPI0013D554E6|nr:RraA family protein [Mycolicibacterium agri]